MGACFFALPTTGEDSCVVEWAVYPTELALFFTLLPQIMLDMFEIFAATTEQRKGSSLFMNLFLHHIYHFQCDFIETLTLYSMKCAQINLCTM